jgi:hypothetical protein
MNRAPDHAGGHRPHQFDWLMLAVSIAMIAWVLLPR